MKKIKLGVRDLYALVDDDDFDWLSQWTWYAQKGHGTTHYAVRPRRLMERQDTVYMHRLILDAAPQRVVDHIDHDGLNNQKHNLRICTQQQNSANAKSVCGEIPYKGVFRRKMCRAGLVSYPIVAKIKKNYKSYWLGTFDTVEKAAMAYDKAAINLFGEFACLNFPQISYTMDDTTSYPQEFVDWAMKNCFIDTSGSNGEYCFWDTTCCDIRTFKTISNLFNSWLESVKINRIKFSFPNP